MLPLSSECSILVLGSAGTIAIGATLELPLVKDGVRRLPDHIVAPLLRALMCIPRRPDSRLTLQRLDHDRAPNWDRKNDYNVIWRGQPIGRIWRHEYNNHSWAGMGPWHWSWHGVADRPDTTGHAPTLEAAMADFRRAWDIPESKVG
jgi:hypothetical protein